jgi:hypothetical protein
LTPNVAIVGRAADEHPVGKDRPGNALPPALGLVSLYEAKPLDLRLTHGQQPLGKYDPAGRLKDEKTYFILNLGHDVQLVAQWQRRAKKERPGQPILRPSRRSTYLPFQLTSLNVVCDQDIVIRVGGAGIVTPPVGRCGYPERIFMRRS